MKAHKNFGIAAAIFMTITIITGMDEEARKTHSFWAALTVFSLIGALISGRKMAAPKKDGGQVVTLDALEDAHDVIPDVTENLAG